jgi:hypothetical protein
MMQARERSLKKEVAVRRRLVVLAAVIAGVFVPRLGIAEYDSLPSYNASTSSSLGRAESALNPASSALGAAAGRPGSSPVENLKAELEEKLKKAQKDLEVSRKESELRKKVEGWRNDIDKLKTSLAIPDILADRKLKEREEKTKQLQSLFSQMPSSAQGLNSAALDTSKLGDACRTNVDFTQFRALADQLKSEPFQYLRREGQKIVDERNEDIKKKKIETAQKLAKHFDELSKQPVGAEAAQQDITQGRIDLFKRDNSLEARLLGLEKTGEAQKKEIGQLRQELVKKVFSDLLPQLSQLNENDGRMEAVVAQFADSALAMARAAKEQAIAGAARATANCNAIADRMGRGNPLAPGTLFNAAYQWVSTVNDTYANQQFFQGIQRASAQLRCEDVTANVETLLGQNLENQIQTIRQVRDPKQAIEGAMMVMNQVGSTLAQVGDVIQPALRSCKRNEDLMKKVEQFVQGTQQQSAAVAQQRQQQQGGAPQQATATAARSAAGTSRNAAGVPGRTTHSAAQPPQRF